MCDTILYNQGDKLDSFYIVLSGVIILHSRDKGAVGICTFDNTCGEEAFQGAMLEFAVAQQQSHLLEVPTSAVPYLKQRMFQQGNRADFLKL